jgi:hypothetical protein
VEEVIVGHGEEMVMRLTFRASRRFLNEKEPAPEGAGSFVA